MGIITATRSKIRPSRFGEVDFSKEREWLKEHRHEYVGQWIVLDGDRLVGHGDNPVPIFAQARAEGVAIPFVKFIRDESEPFCGAWL
jgi:hypothetical protein